MFTIEDIAEGSFVVEYYDSLISAAEGYRREKVAEDRNVYRFYINWRGKRLWYVFLLLVGSFHLMNYL